MDLGKKQSKEFEEFEEFEETLSRSTRRFSRARHHSTRVQPRDGVPCAFHILYLRKSAFICGLPFLRVHS
jgi:hypothetical protein